MKTLIYFWITLLGSLTAFGQCTPADLPVINYPAPFTSCEGDSVTITWTGNLNDNLYWLFYDDVNGTEDTLYTNSITIAVLEYNEYDIVGSGGCGLDGPWAYFEVEANPSYDIQLGQQRICDGDSTLIFGQYQSVSGTYTDSYQTVNGCDSLIHMELIVDPPLTDQLISPTQTYLCDSGMVTINMALSETDVKYYLRDDVTDQIIDGPIVGNGSNIEFSTGMVNSTTSYNVYGERPSYGALFDTSANYLTSSTGYPITLNDNNVTLECWVKWGGITDNGAKTILVNGHEGYAGYSLRLLGSDSTLYVLFGGVGYLYTNYQLIPNTWTHIAVTGDNSNLWTFYVNGVSISSTTINNNPPSPGQKFNIGADVSGSSPFDGVIDEVRIWETARSEFDIQSDMNTCMTGNETDLVAYYTFEHGITDQGLGGVNLEEKNYTTSPWTAGVEHCSLMCGTEMSTITTITVIDVDTTVTVSGATLMSNQTGATYQWLDCNNGNAPISGATGQSFTPTANGSYAVEVTLNGCSEMSACNDITTIGLKENDLNMSLLIYPNPNAGKFYVEISDSKQESFEIELHNNVGALIYTGNMDSNSTHLIEVGGIAPGIYIVRIGNERREIRERIIIK